MDEIPSGWDFPPFDDECEDEPLSDEDVDATADLLAPVERLRWLRDMGRLPPHLEAFVSEELDRLARMPPNAAEYPRYEERLRTIGRLPRHPSAGLLDPVDAAAALRTALDEHHVGHAALKDDLVGMVLTEVLALANGARHRPSPLLLVGPPGTGKTSLVRAVAQALGRPYQAIRAGGADAVAFAGAPSQYIGSTHGRVIEALVRAGTTDPVILLDETDKLHLSSSRPPDGVLLSLLDDQASEFVDEFLTVPVDVSQVWIIATANDLDGVPGPIRDRFRTVTVAAYTAAEKAEIFDRVALPQACREVGVEVGRDVVVDPIARRLLLAGATDAGARDLQRAARRCVTGAAARLVDPHHPRPVLVDVDHLVTFSSGLS